VINKNLQPDCWQDPITKSLIENAPLDEEGLPVLDSPVFSIDEYESFTNPRLVRETVE
jgi:hypothetical protein